jgi:holo-[acyl-carrier protein] synthase
MIAGIGVDLVEVERFEGMERSERERLRSRLFTEAEQAYCLQKEKPNMSFAARFAAKEAFAKALGTGVAKGISWVEIEVRRDAAGRPLLALHGKARDVAESLGITSVSLSISHTGKTAIAFVILEKQG